MEKDVAHVSGWDEGNRSMRKGNRTAWSIKDYNAAVKKYDELTKDRRVKCGITNRSISIGGRLSSPLLFGASNTGMDTLTISNRQMATVSPTN